MNNKSLKAVSLLLMIALLVSALLVGCSDDDDDDNGDGNGNGNGEPTTIYVPLVLPLSGQAAAGYLPGVAPWDAFCDYVNTEDPIPGVELEVIEYDTQYDQAESLLGYQWAKDQGAEFIAWTDTLTAASVLDLANEDEFPVFLGTGTEVIVENPGYVFSTQALMSDMVEGFMKWLEGDWDYAGMGRSPKVGAFGWNITFGIDHAKGAEDYCNAHPDKFEWVGKELAPYGTTSWGSEVDNLKDCDYIIAGAFAGGAATFINELRGVGSDAITVHSEPNMSFWKIYYDSCGADKLDGALMISGGGYVNTDTTDFVTQFKYIIENYCTADEKSAVYGTPYIAITNYWQFYFLEQMLREAVKQVDDPADINGEVLYNVATTMELNVEDYPAMAFSETDRILVESIKMYEYSATTNEFSQISDWLTIPSFE